MGLPDEDKGPSWLRDWGSKTGYTELDTFSGYVDSSALAVDIGSLVAFANALQSEHEQDFRPHVKEVFEGMSAKPTGPPADFVELNEVMLHHRDMLVQTRTALVNHDKAIVAFFTAARTISEEYRGADAMSAAEVEDVETNLYTPVSASNNGGTATTAPVATPEQGPAQTASTTTGSPDNGTEITNA